MMVLYLKQLKWTKNRITITYITYIVQQRKPTLEAIIRLEFFKYSGGNFGNYQALWGNFIRNR